MKAQNSVTPSFMEVYVKGHRGPDPANPNVLCTDRAKEKMVAYGEEMTQRHGPEFNWMHSDIDVNALYHNGGGRRHGRFAFGSRVVEFDRSLPQGNNGRLSQGSSRSSRSARESELLEEARQAREEFRQAQEDQRLGYGQLLQYMSSYIQQLTSSLGPEVTMPPFCPPPYLRHYLQAMPPRVLTLLRCSMGTSLRVCNFLSLLTCTLRALNYLQGGCHLHKAPRHLQGGCHLHKALSRL